MDPDEDFAGSRGGDGEVDKGEDLRAAGLLDLDGFHIVCRCRV